MPDYFIGEYVTVKSHNVYYDLWDGVVHSIMRVRQHNGYRLARITALFPEGAEVQVGRDSFDEVPYNTLEKIQ